METLTLANCKNASTIINKNPKTVDLSGMFLKQIEDTSKSLIFQEFADLNAECKIEFILSSHDLEKFGFPFILSYSFNGIVKSSS
jgi:hypothetical protein